MMSREGMRELLDSIPEMFRSHSAESAGGAALAGALEVLKATGGKITLLIAAMPNTGMLAMKVLPSPPFQLADPLAWR